MDPFGTTGCHGHIPAVLRPSLPELNPFSPSTPTFIHLLSLFHPCAGNMELDLWGPAGAGSCSGKVGVDLLVIWLSFLFSSYFGGGEGRIEPVFLCIALAVLLQTHRDLLASTSQVLAVKVCTTTGFLC